MGGLRVLSYYPAADHISKREWLALAAIVSLSVGGVASIVGVLIFLVKLIRGDT